MLNKSLNFGVLMLYLMLTGCATHQPQQEQVPQYSIVIDEPQRIRFSGKGAGAGMMLSSSVGPMGIAIGVAIDEGIAKDIHAAFEADGHSLDALVKSAIDEAYELKGYKALVAKTGGEGAVVHLRRIGVKMSQGENVVADFDGEIRWGAGVAQLPPVEVADDASPVPLELVKKDGDVTFDLLRRALATAVYSAL